MFGRKKMKTPQQMAKIKSKKDLDRAQAQNYMIQVEAILNNYNHLIENNTSPNDSKHFANQKQSFIRAVKSTDEYKGNQKKFDKIIAAAEAPKKQRKGKDKKGVSHG